MVKINIFVRKYSRDVDGAYGDLYKGGEYIGQIVADGLGIYFNDEYVDEWCNWSEVTDYTIKKHMRTAARKTLGCPIISREQQLETRIEQLMGMLELSLAGGKGSADAGLNWNRRVETPKERSEAEQIGGAISKEFRVLGVNPSEVLLKPSEILKRVKAIAVPINLIPPPKTIIN